MNIDEQIEIAKKQVIYAEMDKNISIVQLTTVYQNLIDLLWMKMNILIAKEKTNG